MTDVFQVRETTGNDRAGLAFAISEFGVNELVMMVDGLEGEGHRTTLQDVQRRVSRMDALGYVEDLIDEWIVGFLTEVVSERS